MRNAILPAIWALKSILILPTGAWAGGGLCWFPYHSLLSSAEVGHYWTYSMAKLRAYHDADGTARIDSQYTTRSIAVVGSHRIGDWTYLELSHDDLELSHGDGLYRVDETGRTWQYDTGTGTERVFWDIDDAFQNGRHSDGYVWYNKADVEEIVVAGGVFGEWDLFAVTRGGPFEREAWDSGSDPYPYFIDWYMDPWKEKARRLQESGVWNGIAELYEYHLVFPETSSYSLVAPGLGVLYCGYWKGPPEYGSGRDYYLESYGQVATMTGAVSFGPASWGTIKSRLQQAR